MPGQGTPHRGGSFLRGGRSLLRLTPSGTTGRTGSSLCADDQRVLSLALIGREQVRQGVLGEVHAAASWLEELLGGALGEGQDSGGVERGVQFGKTATGTLLGYEEDGETGRGKREGRGEGEVGRKRRREGGWGEGKAGDGRVRGGRKAGDETFGMNSCRVSSHAHSVCHTPKCTTSATRSISKQKSVGNMMDRRLRIRQQTQLCHSQTQGAGVPRRS